MGIAMAITMVLEAVAVTVKWCVAIWVVMYMFLWLVVSRSLIDADDATAELSLNVCWGIGLERCD